MHGMRLLTHPTLVGRLPNVLIAWKRPFLKTPCRTTFLLALRSESAIPHSVCPELSQNAFARLQKRIHATHAVMHAVYGNPSLPPLILIVSPEVVIGDSTVLHIGRAKTGRADLPRTTVMCFGALGWLILQHPRQSHRPAQRQHSRQSLVQCAAQLQWARICHQLELHSSNARSSRCIGFSLASSGLRPLRACGQSQRWWSHRGPAAGGACPCCWGSPWASCWYAHKQRH